MKPTYYPCSASNIAVDKSTGYRKRASILQMRREPVNYLIYQLFKLRHRQIIFYFFWAVNGKRSGIGHRASFARHNDSAKLALSS